MIKPNWDIFKAKFNENPQGNLEWFCYLLFCKQYNRTFGLFRYKNQSAIETDPIYIEDCVIGWQAKFYETTLSSNKDKILSTIQKTKRDYPDITKILFYTNQEWGQSKGKKPKGLEEIETKAKELKVILEWKTASFFESEFVTTDNELYAKYFFSYDKSIFNIIEDLQKHTQTILNEIRTYIPYNDKCIEIDRNKLLEELMNEKQGVVILSGAGGVGKTVLVKNLYEQLKGKIPFFVFKATEFELRSLNDLFGIFSFYDFINAFNDEEYKIIVIDSSERLLDLKNSDPFKEFLSEIIRSKWKIIFTTRENYLENLNYQFFEIYNIVPRNVPISNLDLNELFLLSNEYSFSLPKDEKLLELIRNPFYLNEYLKFYNDEELGYIEFKNKLWNKNITKSKPKRELCFLQVVFESAKNGQFYLNPNCDHDILDDELVKDGVLGYESSGYFITHDIYEEWGLERIINNEYLKKSNNLEFFQRIGHSIPIRRSFRNWLSEKLLLEDHIIKKFIDESIDCSEIEQFWKDDIFISVLLSNYSKNFFTIYKKELLSDNQRRLKRLTFILQIACKEIDHDLLEKLFNIKNPNLLSLEYIYTKPKGQGWEDLIKFVYENIEVIGINNINFILPVIHDWNNNYKKGITTRFSSLLALRYYQWLMNNKSVHLHHDNTESYLFQTILFGSSEIENELIEIFESIIENNWKYYGNPYYDLSKSLLKGFDGFQIISVLPKYVLRIAEMFWSHSPKNSENYLFSGLDIEKYFGLERSEIDYFPSSAYQTPIYWLIKQSPKETINFIIEFINKSVRCYANSNFDNSVKKSIVIFDDGEREQYISHCLWNMYRGGGSPVSPNLLQSIHMALEKYFLELGNSTNSKQLESWLFDLLKKSESASISSVVTSIVLAYPDKTFNIAEVLFKTKDFFLFDTGRYLSDLTIKTMYSLGYGLNYKNQIYENERIKTCEDKHRKWNLEQCFLYYQFSKGNNVSNEDITNRKTRLWEILDNYYQNLPEESVQTKEDKVWRLYLARMDIRKMIITTEKTEEELTIQFNPEIDPAVKEFSANFIAENTKSSKYLSLKLWAEFKFSKDEKYKIYSQYENNPKLALKEVKEISKEFNSIITSNKNDAISLEKNPFFLINHSIPAYVCSVLFRDHYSELANQEKIYCKDIILKFALSSIDSLYQYQISDGVQPAIALLPKILHCYPEERKTIKTILLLTLFLEDPVGGFFTNKRFSIFPVNAIQNLWKDDTSDAQSLVFGYLLLAPKFFDLIEKVRKEDFTKNIYGFNANQAFPRFLDENRKIINALIENKLKMDNFDKLQKCELFILETTFQLIPSRAELDDLNKIAKIIISVFSEKLSSHERKDEIQYEVKHEFLESYASFVLRSELKDIQDFMQPFITNFNASEYYADLFNEFVFAEDALSSYEQFWAVWESFKGKVLDYSQHSDNFGFINKIVNNYLLGHPYWKEDAIEWHSLKEKEKKFFNDISIKIGPCPSALYAISKLLNNIGNKYIDDGICWIYNIINNNNDLGNMELETNTIYYIESAIRKYISMNREKIKKSKDLKNKMIFILDFLVNKGSVVGFLVRENIM
ncbi:MAG: AVAST type 4 anti-phage nuclease Avs4 [Anaerolineaceae bacterium]